MAQSLRDREQVASFLREQGEEVELIEGGVRLPVDLAPDVSGRLEIFWDDAARVRTPLPFEVPLNRRQETLALLAEINPDLDTGRFVLGPPLSYEILVERDAGGGLPGDALLDAIDASRSNALAYFTHFEALLQGKPAAPALPVTAIASKPIKLTAGEVARVKEACAADWRPFLHRLEGRLDCYERMQPWWKQHRIVDVQSPLPMPAVGIPVAFGPGGDVKILRGHLEHLVEMARRDPPPPLTDPERARFYATTCAGWTSDAQWGELTVAAFDDIPFRQMLAPEEKELIRQLRMAHAAEMHAPRLEKTDAGFLLKVWTVSMSRLVYRELVVPPDGQLRRVQRIIADPIPVPPGKAWGLVGQRYVPVA